MRIITGCMRPTDTTFLHVLAGTTPPDISREARVAKPTATANNNPDHLLDHIVEFLSYVNSYVHFTVCCGKNKVKKYSSAHSRIWFTWVARVPIMKSSALQINSKTLVLPPSWCWTLRWRVHARNRASWHHTCRLLYNMSLLDWPNKTLLRRAMLYGQTTQAGKRNQHILCRKHRDDVWKNYYSNNHFFVESSTASVK